MLESEGSYEFNRMLYQSLQQLHSINADRLFADHILVKFWVNLMATNIASLIISYFVVWEPKDVVEIYGPLRRERDE